MKKNVLLYKLKSFKRSLLIFLLAMSSCYCAFAQTRQITGKVTSSEDGLEMPGVSVRVKGTSDGVTTDVQGVYKLSVPANAVIEFSFVGYTTQQITVGTKNVYNVKLSSDVKSLVEVNVVAIGYGTSRVKDLSGSISSINAATIAKTPVTTLDQALQGRASGVQVTSNDASPGGNITVLVRGIGSLSPNGNSPLYIVDGYPTNGGINNINPSDIATIDVLKDASATAIYGIRAANGVVIITTKKGKKDGVQVSLDAYNAFQSKPKEYQVLNAQQFATLAKELADSDPTKQFTILPNWTNPSSLTNADWQNAIYRSSLTQNYSLAVRGGNEKVQSATSVGYYDQKGIVLGSYFKRLSLGLNLDYQATKWLKSSTNAKYTYKNENNPYGTNSLQNLSELPPTLDGGNSQTSEIKDGNGNYGFYNPIYTYVAKYGNPVYTIENNQYQNISQFLLANTSLEATIFDGLKFKTSAGVNISGYNGSFFSPSDDRLVQQYGAQAGSSQNALYNQHLRNNFEWLWENTLSYDKTFGQHAINVLAGVSEQEFTNAFMGGSIIPPNNVIRDLSQGTNLQLDANTFLNGNTQDGNGQKVSAIASQFARLTYKFADRYILTGTVRRDGSSAFDEGHKYGIFPSGAVAWKAKEESFLKNVDWLSDLKFRGSYGKVGNSGSIPLFQYAALYSNGAPAASKANLGYPFGKTGGSNGTYQAGVAAFQPANPNLKWETDYQTDLGMDIGFLKGDLTLTVDWFNRKSQDFLLTLAAPAQSGFSYLTKNIGSMENKGLEIALNYNHRIKDFQYGAGLTFSAIKNKLTSITSGTDFVGNFGTLVPQGAGWSTFSQTRIGQPVGEFYGYQSLGIFTKTQLDALNNAAQAKYGPSTFYQKTGTSPGDRYYADTNGDGKVTPDDQVSLGSPIPKFFGGLNLDASYKSWDFNLYFYGVYGNKICNYQESALETFQNRGFVGVENVSQNYYLNRWTTSNPSNTYARALYNDNDIGNGLPSSAWIQDGSFLKLKNLTVGYTLPLELVKKLTLSKVRVYFSTQNLFTLTKYTGLDPEIGLQEGNPTQNGVDNGTYPSSKYYTVGLNVTF